MKRPKKLTRAMRDRLIKLKLNPLNWQYIKNTPDGLTLVHKKSGKTKVIRS